LTVAIAGAFAFAACNALTGAGDLEVGAVANDGGLARADAADATRIVTADGSSGAVDAAPPVDTGPPPKCPSAGNSCVPAPPDTWDGPFLVYDGAPNTAPSCPNEMPEQVDENIGSPVGPITCADCRCQTPTGATCTATILQFSDTGCATQVGSVPADTCQTPGSAAAGSFKVTVDVSGGSCTPFVLTKTKQPITWPEVLRHCKRPGSFTSDGCSSDQLCVPDGVAPFNPHTCIRTDDPDATCPAPWTQQLHTVDANPNDTRDCSASTCSCGSASGINCNGSVHNYGAVADCSGFAPTTVQAPTPPNGAQSCPVANAGSSQKLVPGSLSTHGGSCPASGNPSATGGVSAGNTVSTICCVP
jgi:hypothetical protein